MKTSGILFFVILLCFSVSAQYEKISISDTIPYSSSIAAVSDTLPNLNFFEDETPMDLTLKYDITSFIRNKMKGDYLNAELMVHYKNYTETKNIRLKARGNNRREQCFFPPIFLNFKTDPFVNSELEGYNKIKLVTHCSTTKVHTDYLFKEYLAYKIYNVLTDNSFRVKLLDIRYIDTGKRKRNYEKYGILIEPLELLAARQKSIKIDGNIIRENNVIEEDADILAFFQYMIGNTDWRIKGGHNIKYIKSLTKVTNKVTPIPYDFDFAGFVETHYSHPQTWTSIKNVKEREYLGYCRNSDEAYLKTINLFLDKKDKIIETIKSFSYLSERDRENLLSYIEDFYRLLNNPDRFITTLKFECRTDF